MTQFIAFLKVKSCIKWDKWKNITCTKRILWWNHWTLTTECTFTTWHWRFQSCWLFIRDNPVKIKTCNTVSQPLPTMNCVAAMVQGHPYWQNEKYGNSAWGKLCFFCYQNQPWDAEQISALFKLCWNMWGSSEVYWDDGLAVVQWFCFACHWCHWTYFADAISVQRTSKKLTSKHFRQPFWNSLPMTYQ